ncbi:hypothetical protein RV11_GL000065 [Enterococcus phoeniculicola]|jgi:GntR family trehalose operon transcriptional repressor|uniref:HTH gntR-type domain-containing protein n=1 Tax=Enterococcus phoeniculicola ATCC BAA-412 TaxID=1158610 RepID=R3TV97_9ENTE|nr:GntR family transcriptional regulator [Enterococcus phoeniculicola]EOL45499.1 hypothetical protein UC3_01389 [Enterococcus phoeniculicola ATCC BAA-412]EOT74861.1 hypothetical protein I589_02461 [Enterococcus phoeniculicola ATCC BAA-412]OJG73699.1 hypothetical protein RV11_GL000065 [Enterococcus phoeniculicola]
MAIAKFYPIYEELKQRIHSRRYEGMLPTENELTKEFEASRNTIRRAISLLNEEGYVYSVKGRGVLILESLNSSQWSFGAGNFGGLKAIQSSNHLEAKTRVLTFEKIVIDDALARSTPFKKNEVVYKIERLRILNEKATMLDLSYFKAELIPELSETIVEQSIYAYFSKNNVKIAAAKRRFSVTAATDDDLSKLDLDTNNCVGMMENLVFNDMGRLIEYTRSRFVPDQFSLSYFVQNHEAN